MIEGTEGVMAAGPRQNVLWRQVFDFPGKSGNQSGSALLSCSIETVVAFLLQLLEWGLP